MSPELQWRKEGDMLVLSRKVDEGLHIGNDIHVKVLEIKRGRVRLGVEAPRGTSVLRDELERLEDIPARPIANGAAEASAERPPR